MCKCCQVLTWKLASLVIALGLLFISFIFGPLQTIFIITGYHPELEVFLDIELDYAILLISSIVAAWLTLAASTVLVVGTFKRSGRLLDCFVLLTVVNVLAAAVLVIRYLVLCTLIDTVCLDHTPGRTDDDVEAVAALSLLYLGYVVFWMVAVFVVWNYKLVINYRFNAFY